MLADSLILAILPDQESLRRPRVTGGAVRRLPCRTEILTCYPRQEVFRWLRHEDEVEHVDLRILVDVRLPVVAAVGTIIVCMPRDSVLVCQISSFFLKAIFSNRMLRAPKRLLSACK